MNSPFKKVLLFVIVLVLSYLTAPYVGRWYDTMSFQDGGLMGAKNFAVFFAGFIISYIFFIPLIYGLFGIKKNKYWIIWPLLPAVLLDLGADISHVYISLILIAVALILAWLIRLLISKLHRPNPPMVIK